MSNIDWITDRQPTAADGDHDGDVRVEARINKSSNTVLALAHWSLVKTGTPWSHTSCWMPPAQQPELPAKFDFKPGQVWRSRKGMTCEIIEIEDGCKGRKPIHSNLYGNHWHYLNGKSCLGGHDLDHEDDLVELISEPEPEPEPESESTPESESEPVVAPPAAEIPEPIRTGAAPFYVVVVSDDSGGAGGGDPMVAETQIPEGSTLRAALEQRARIGHRYGTTYVAECRIIPELTREVLRASADA